MTSALLDRARADRAVAVGTEVAASVVDRDRITAGVVDLHAHTTFPFVRWHPAALALGDAGAAVVCAVLDGRAPDAGWDRTGRRFLSDAVAALADPALPLSLFTGACGVAAAACLASRGGQRYRTLRDNLDRRLLPSLVAGESRFDLIHGLSGWVAYLLLGGGGPGREAMLGRSASALASSLTRVRDAEPGVAHGLAGPLAALALARSASPRTEPLPAVDAAIHHLASRLTRAVDTAGGNHTAWCGDSPGIARALWLAGAATDDDRYRRTGIDLALAGLTRPVGERGYRTPTLCHGIAGHLLITALFWWDTAEPRFRTAARELCDHLLDHHDPRAPFGFRDRERASHPVDNPGLLSGAAGVALVLLAVAADQPPAWSRLFLLG